MCGELMVGAIRRRCVDCTGDRSETREPREAERLAEGFEMMDRDGQFD